MIAVSGKGIQKEMECEGVQAFLAKPFALREFKRVVQKSIPPTREELIKDHSGGEFTIGQKAFALAKAGDFIGARKAIELLDDTGSRRGEYIWLLAYQIRAGDLAGAKETVLEAPSLRIGGHWVQCMINPLVKAGDIHGAWAIANNLISVDEQAFHKAMIVAQHGRSGRSLWGQGHSLAVFAREMGRDRAIREIASALIAAGNFQEALSLVCHMAQEDELTEP